MMVDIVDAEQLRERGSRGLPMYGDSRYIEDARDAFLG